MPGVVVHEAWVPAGSLTLNIEEGGWAVHWLHGGLHKTSDRRHRLLADPAIAATNR
jgi:hypothetical protein